MIKFFNAKWTYNMSPKIKEVSWLTMKGIYFTREERDMLEHERDIARKNKDLDLFVKTNSILLVSDGHLQKDVADMLGVPLRTLEWWIAQYRTTGMSSFLKGPYPGRRSLLTAEQKKELVDIIVGGPEEAGFDTGVWTAATVGSLIKSRFGVDYCHSQVRRILGQEGLSVQVPRRSLSEANPEEQLDWIEKRLPEIKREVESDDGVEVHEDESSFQQAGSLTRTWCLVGKGCETKSFPTRKSVKAMGAVVIEENPKWHFRFMQKFNSLSFVEFLKQLVRQYDGKRIHMITDNAPYHKGRAVKTWLEDNADRIKLHFLPKYSPKFNATEYVWRKVKRMTTHNRYFPTIEQLKQAIFRRFNRFQGNPASLRSTVAGFT
jgi:transposase